MVRHAFAQNTPYTSSWSWRFASIGLFLQLRSLLIDDIRVWCWNQDKYLLEQQLSASCSSCWNLMLLFLVILTLQTCSLTSLINVSYVIVSYLTYPTLYRSPLPVGVGDIVSRYITLFILLYYTYIFIFWCILLVRLSFIWFVGMSCFSIYLFILYIVFIEIGIASNGRAGPVVLLQMQIRSYSYRMYCYCITYCRMYWYCLALPTKWVRTRRLPLDKRSN